MAKRRNFIPDFKARVALDAFWGDKTIQGISSKHKLHPNQVITRKRQAMDGLGEFFLVSLIEHELITMTRSMISTPRLAS